MNLEVKQFENELMKSNCFIIVDWGSKRCLVIDPASRDSAQIIAYVETNGLLLDFILLTHEHADHTWGVNPLLERYSNSRLVCSQLCNKYAKDESRAYFLYYYDDPDYRYVLRPADIVINTDEDSLQWNGNRIGFILTPGHSRGSMCIHIGNMLFSGDTVIPFKPFFNGRGSSVDTWRQSIEKLERLIPLETTLYPGHGQVLAFDQWEADFNKSVR